MSTVTFQSNPVELAGNFPQVGQSSPDFTVVGGDLSEITRESLKGKNVVLSFFPSVHTGVCAMGMRKFNGAASSVADTVILGVSQDLPFAAGRFCSAEGIEAVKTGSTFRNNEVLEAFGVKISEGALANISARAVVVLDKESNVVHSELVAEITDEPNYEAALAVLK